MQSLSSQLFELVAEGAVRFKIYGEYEFSAEGIRKSQEDITGRGTVGKLIVKIA
jgi:NADPH2:quinone reductase